MNFAYILLSLLLLNLIVMVHELGHYIAGRLCGIGIDEFAIGMGPKIFGFKKGGIQYSLRAFPIGGFCNFTGEDQENTASNAMNNQPVWKRFITVLSGPLMNFVLAYAVLCVLVFGIGFAYNVPKAIDVTSDMPAQAAGLQPGDVIEQVNGEPIEYTSDGTQLMLNRIAEIGASGEPMTLTIRREDALHEITLHPVKTESGVYQIGIAIGTEYEKFPFLESFHLVNYNMGNMSTIMVDSFRKLIFYGEGVNETMGPVGTVTFMSQQAKNGIDTILYLIVVISMNLGIINLLPLPALDGGRLLFLIVEAIRRKPVKAELEGWVHGIGFLMLIGLMIVVTFKDIYTLIAK